MRGPVFRVDSPFLNLQTGTVHHAFDFGVPKPTMVKSTLNPREKGRMS